MPLEEIRDNRIDPNTGTPGYFKINNGSPLSKSKEDWASIGRARRANSSMREPVGLAFEPYGGVKDADETLGFSDLWDIPEGRAQHQSGLELTGKALGQTVNELTLGTLEGLGYFVDAPHVLYDVIAGNENDFDNAWSSAIRGVKEGINESLFNVYQTKAAQEGSFLDATSIAANASSMATTVALMIPAAGMGRIAAGLATGIARLAGKTGKGASTAIRMANAATAGVTSRLTESVMEAGQFVRSNEDKIKEDLARKYQPIVEQEIKNLPMAMPYNPEDPNNYTIEDRERDAKAIFDKYKKQIETETTSKLFKGASDVYKANLALAPLDVLQWSGLMNVFTSPINKSVMKAINLVGQPVSEGMEEAWQAGSQMEALYGQMEGGKFLGPGFADRTKEYLKSGELQTSAFWGAVGGGVFDAMGPIARTIGKTSENMKAAWNTAKLTKDIVGKKTIESESIISTVMGEARRNNLDNMYDSITNYGNSITDESLLKMGVTKEEVAKNVKDTQDAIDFIRDQKKILDANPKFEGRDELKLDYIELQLRQKNNALIAKEASDHLDELRKEAAKEIKPDLLDLKNKKSILSALKEFKKNIAKIPTFKNDKTAMQGALLEVDLRISSVESIIKAIEETHNNNTGAKSFDDSVLVTSKDEEIRTTQYKNIEMDFVNNQLKKEIKRYDILKQRGEKEIADKDAELKKKRAADEKAEQDKLAKEKIEADKKAAEQKKAEDTKKKAETKKENKGKQAVVSANPESRYSTNPELYETEAKELNDVIVAELAKAGISLGNEILVDETGKPNMDAKGFLEYMNRLLNSVIDLTPEEQAKDGNAIMRTAIINYLKTKKAQAENTNDAENTNLTGETPISDTEETPGSSSDVGYVPPSDKLANTSGLGDDVIVSHTTQFTGGASNPKRDLDGMYVPYPLAIENGMGVDEWNYVNNPENLTPGSKIEFVVNMGKIKDKNDLYHSSLKFGSDEFIERFQILIVQNGVIVGFVNAPSKINSKAKNKKLITLRKEIYNSIKDSTETGVISSGITSKVSYKFSGRIGTKIVVEEGTTKSSRPHEALDEGRPLIFGVARKIGGKVIISAGKGENMERYSNIEVDEKHNGKAFMLIEGANGRIIPVLCYTSRVRNRVNGAISIFEKEANRIIEQITPENQKNSVSLIQSLAQVASIGNVKYFTKKDPKTGAVTEVFQIKEGNKTRSLDRKHFINHVRNSTIQISEKFINKKMDNGVDYNKFMSENSALHTDLMPGYNIINANFAYDISNYEKKTDKPAPKIGVEETAEGGAVIKETPIKPVAKKTTKKPVGTTKKAPSQKKETPKTEEKPKSKTLDDLDKLEFGEGPEINLFSVVDDGKGTEEDSYEKWNETQETDWFKSKFGSNRADMLKVQQGLINIIESGGIQAWGQFKNAIVILSSVARVGTTYHEAFHVVFHLFLNDTQRANILKEARSRYKSPTKIDIESILSINENMTQAEAFDVWYEEKMAEEFRDYVISRENTKVPLSKKIADFFKNIYYVIKSRITNDLSIDQLFLKTQRGSFRDANFTRDISKFDVNRADVAYNNIYEREVRVEAIVSTMSKALDDVISKGDPRLAKMPRINIINKIERDISGKPMSGVNALAIMAYRAMQNRAKKYKEAGLLSTKQEEDTIKMLENIIKLDENGNIVYGELFNKAIRKFAYKEGVKITTLGQALSYIDSSMDDSGLLVTTEEEDTQMDGWQIKTDQMSAKESLSKEVKRALGFIPKLNKDGVTEQKDDLGYVKYHDFNQVFAELIRELSGISDSKDMLDKLSDLAEEKPQYKSLIQALAKDNHLKTKFFNAFSRFHREYVVMIEDRSYYTDKSGMLSYNVFYKLVTANRNNIKNLVIDEIRNNSIDPNSNKLLNPNGDINIDKAKEYEKRWVSDVKSFLLAQNKGKYNKEIAELFVFQLNRIGIPVTTTDLDRLYVESFRREEGKKIKISPEENLGVFLRSVSTIFDKYTSGQNPLKVETTDTKTVDTIGKLLGKTRIEVLESSFRNSEGNTVYSHQIPSFLSKKIEEFKNNPKATIEFLRSTPFYKNSPWLQSLEDDAILKEFGIVEIDGLKSWKKDKGTTYTEMSEKDYETVTLNMYFNNGADSAYYRFPVTSDSPKMIFIKFKKAPLEENIFQKSIFDKLHDVFLQERARQDNVRARREQREELRKNNQPIPDNLKEIEFYDSPESEKFLLLDDNIFKGVDLDNEVEVKAKIKEWALAEAAKDFDRLVALGVLGDSANVDQRIKAVNNKWGGSQEAFHMEYFLNSLLANTQSTTLFSGDPAFYKKDGPGLYTRTIDYQKRNKQVISPAMMIDTKAEYELTPEEAALEKDGVSVLTVGETYSGIILKDQKIPSSVANNIYKALIKGGLSEDRAMSIASAYGFYNITIVDPFNGEHRKAAVFNENVVSASFVVKKDKTVAEFYDKDGNVIPLKVDDYIMSKTVNVTDAQSYITLPRYREILVGLGRWTPIHQKMYPKLMNSTATAEEIAFIMQPIKPFYFGQMKMMPDDNLIRPFQIKNSEYLLIPQMVESSSTMKKLHDHMISNGIGFVGFESAIKVGGSGKADSNLSDIENATVFNLENKSYGLQQETPEHYLDSSSLYGSQIRKLILSDIDKDAEFNLFGKSYSRDELISLYHEIIVSDLKEAFGEVQGALGSNEKIYELLINEIRERNLGEDLERAIKLVPDGKGGMRFNLPLFHPLHSKRIESLINSIFKNRVTKQKIKGGSFVQLSAFGYSDQLELKIDTETGRLVEAQCMLPWWSEKFFKPLIGENGQLDISRVPDNLLEMVGYRIPTEDKYSMLPLKVVGFLPPSAGGAVMLPMEITTISGSDFDIDKLYIMMPEFKVKYDIEKIKNDAADLMENEELNALEYILEYLDDSDQTYWSEEQIRIYDKYKNAQRQLKKTDASYSLSISKVKYDRSKSPSENSKQARNNAKIDITREILTNKDTFKNFINPGGFDTLKEAASHISKLQGGKNESMVLSLPSTQTELFKRNMAGVALKGIFANHNAHHAILQHTNIELANDVYVARKAYRSLNNIEDYNGNNISRAVAEFLAAAVDNAKDPVLGFMNINTYTANTAALLARLGIPIEHIGLILSQPIIVKLSELYFNNGGNKSAENKAYEELEKLALDKITTAANLQKLEEGYADTTIDQLEANIKSGNMATVDQFLLLNWFKKTQMNAEALNLLVRANRADTIGAGPTEAANELLIDLNRLAYESEALVNHQEFLEGKIYPMTSAFYKWGIAEPNKFMKNLFPWSRKAFSFVKDKAKRDTKRGELNEKQLTELNYEILGYLASSFSFYDVDQKERTKIITGTPILFKAIKDSNREFFESNALLNKFAQAKDDNFEILSFKNTGSIKTEEQQFIKQAFYELLSSNEKFIYSYAGKSYTISYSDFAKRLVRYSYLTSGFKFTHNSFSHILPIEFYESTINEDGDVTFNDFLNDEFEAMNEDAYEEMYKSFLNQMYRNHYDDLTYVPQVDSKLKNITGKMVYKGKVPIGFIVDKSNKSTGKGLLIKRNRAEWHVPFASFKVGKNTYLYEKIDIAGDEDVAIYVITKKLGIPGKVIEYSRSDNAEIESVFEENNPFKGFNREQALVEVHAAAGIVLDIEIPEVTTKTESGIDYMAMPHSVTKVISGAQSGADQAGLDIAEELGYERGGTAAANFAAFDESGNRASNKEYAQKHGLKEGSWYKNEKTGNSDPYHNRTISNAQEADGTIWFGNENSPGGRLTLGTVAQKGRPSPLVNPKSAYEIRQWLIKNNIKTLNVAGNREHTNPGIYIETKKILAEALGKKVLKPAQAPVQQQIPNPQKPTTSEGYDDLFLDPAGFADEVFSDEDVREDLDSLRDEINSLSLLDEFKNTSKSDGTLLSLGYDIDEIEKMTPKEKGEIIKKSC